MQAMKPSEDLFVNKTQVRHTFYRAQPSTHPLNTTTPE